jgi:hypothetical protein
MAGEISPATFFNASIRAPDGQITFVSHVAMSSPSRKNIPLNPSGKSAA